MEMAEVGLTPAQASSPRSSTTSLHDSTQDSTASLRDSTDALPSQPLRDRRQERLNSLLLSALFDSQPVDKIKKLVEGGASVEATCRESGASALHVAALAGDIEVGAMLLAAGAQPHARDRAGRLPLHVAAWDGELPFLLLLTEHAPALVDEPILPPTTFLCHHFDSWNHKHDLINKYWEVMKTVPAGSTALHVACRRSKEVCVRHLLGAGANPSTEDCLGLCPVDVIGLNVQQDPTNREADSSQGSHVGIAKLLLTRQRSGDVEPRPLVRLKSVDEHRSVAVTALHTAVSDNNLGLIEVLLSEGMDPLVWNETGITALHLAVKYRFEDALRLVLEREADRGVVNAVDCYGRSLLHAAVEEAWTDGVSLLLEEGADPTLTDYRRRTVLHVAAASGNVKILSELLTLSEAAKLVNRVDEDCLAAVHFAVEGGWTECARALLAAEASAAVLLPDGRTLLHLAVAADSLHLVDLLLAQPETRRLKDNRSNRTSSGQAPVHVAAALGHLQTLEKLIKFGCDLLARTTDEWGSTALHLGARFGHEHIVACILRHDEEGLTLGARDAHGWYPLHIAAEHGHAACVDTMLRAGADIAAQVVDEQGTRYSGLDIIMTCIHRPIDFLIDILDSYIRVDPTVPVTNPQSKIEIDFDLLIPADPSIKQLAVLEAVLNNGNQDLEQAFLLHPVVQAFLHVKSKNMLILFAIFFDIFFALSLFLSLVAYLGPFALVQPLLRSILVGLISINILVEVVNMGRLQRYYFSDWETWLKWAVYLASILMAAVQHELVLRYCLAISVLLAWLETLLLMAKYPAWGIYVLMFTTVATNIIKVLSVFGLLLIGFALSFRTLFLEREPFDSMWDAFVKVIVMVYELDYRGTLQETAESEGPVFGVVTRAFYLGFVLLISVSLVNLMLGLAVSDIAELKRRGRARRLAKRVAFLAGLENVVGGWLGRRLSWARRARAFPVSLVVKAGTPLCPEPSPLPARLKEAVIEKARSVQQAARPLPAQPILTIGSKL